MKWLVGRSRILWLRALACIDDLDLIRSGAMVRLFGDVCRAARARAI
jgi:hypothetical protein